MEQQNLFTKGIVSDLANKYVQPDNWVFPTHNIRIFNKKGKGFVVTTHLGNEELCNIPDAYILAVEEHRNIIYIVAVHKDNNDNWLTGIGCYPYPTKWIDASGEGFTDTFNWLKNYKPNVSVPGKDRAYMDTAKFEYEKTSEVKLIIDDAFDESANLYLCDGVHSDKVVNSGFRNDGTINDIVYSESDFEGKINHVLYSLNPPVINSVRTPTGGVLKPGQYHLFFAYKTISFDKTEYSVESFPISVSFGNTSTSVFGIPDQDGQGEQLFTNKKIEVELSNLDLDYAYLSIGVIRFFGNGSGLHREEYEIVKNFPLTKTTQSITIDGNEDVKLLTSGELYQQFVKERISKDHVFLNARIWKANLTAESYDKSVLKDLSLKVTASEFASLDVDGHGYNDIVHDDYTDMMTYQDPEKIYKYLGYFKNEVYPFAIRYLMKNGVVTDAYPTTGSDGNTKGLFKFTDSTDDYKILGVKFDVSALKAEIANNPTKYSNIKGFYIVRGERIKNFLYDGVLEKTAKGVNVSKNRYVYNTDDPPEGHLQMINYIEETDLWFASDDVDNAYHVPVFRRYKKGSDPLKDIIPLKSNNYYTFPHACYNDNGNDRSKFKIDLASFGIGSEVPLYEYSNAVENPYRVAPNSDGEWPDANCDPMIEDALDTKLIMSDDHFALFSPDFMTEIDHLTNTANKYYLKVYKKYNGSTYSEITDEFHPTDNEYNNQHRKTRVFELGTASTITVKFASNIRVQSEIYTSGTSTVDTTKWKELNGTAPCDVVDIQDWNSGDLYRTAPGIDTGHTIIANNTSLIFYVVKYDDGSGVKTWVCTKDTYDPPTGDDVTPGASNSSGNVYWVECTVQRWSQEYADYQFTSNSSGLPSVADSGQWVAPSCEAYNDYSITVTSSSATDVNELYQATIYNIDKGTHKGRGHFCSYAEDGKEYKITGKKGLYSLLGEYKAEQKAMIPGNFWVKCDLIHYNRSYQTPAFMGVIFDGTSFKYDDGATYMVKVYKKNPDTIAFFDDIKNDFNSEYTQYWIISDYQNLLTATNTIDVYKGDNFKSMSWFRMSHSVDYDDNNENGHPSRGFRAWYKAKLFGNFENQGYLKSAYFLDNSYGHGELYGMFTSNRRNINLRSLLTLTDKDNNDLNYKFFPQVADTGDPLGWIYSSEDASDVVESLNINDGYNDVTGFLKTLGVPLNVPYDSLKKGTRVAFSERRIVDSYRDGYRAMNIQNVVDFETNYGEIMRIFELFGSLFTIRRDAVVKHYIGQKKLSEDLGYSESVIYLSDEVKIVAYYGIQDWHAFLKTKNAVYLVDVKNNMLYNVSLTYLKDSGTPINSPALLSQKYMVEKETRELIDILSDKRTTPIDMNGVSIGYNPDYGEVYFCFLNGDNIKNIVFNENLGFFTGSSENIASLYSTFGKHHISVLNGSKGKVGSLYLWDGDSASMTFYGRSETCSLSFIINGNTEKENSVTLTKIFESLRIGSPNIPIKKIYYETELQKGEYNFSVDSAEYWKDSKWTEGYWNVPVIKENVADSDSYYNTDSLLRGKWLKVTLEFDSDKSFWITEILSKFNLSFS